MIKIDILSDPICPWCLIGKTFLDRALEIRPDHVFTLEWHPYMLNPKMPKNGMDREEYLINKFGSKHNATEAYQKIIETISKNVLPIKHQGQIGSDNISIFIKSYFLYQLSLFDCNYAFLY